MKARSPVSSADEVMVRPASLGVGAGLGLGLGLMFIPGMPSLAAATTTKMAKHAIKVAALFQEAIFPIRSMGECRWLSITCLRLPVIMLII